MRRCIERRGGAEVWLELGHGWATYRAVWWTPGGSLYSAPSRKSAERAWLDVPVDVPVDVPEGVLG